MNWLQLTGIQAYNKDMEEQLQEVSDQPVQADSSQSTISSETLPKKIFKLPLIFGVLICFFMLGGLTYLGYENHQLKQKIDELSQQQKGDQGSATTSVTSSKLSPISNPNHNPSPSASTMTNRFENWKTYTNLKYYYTFKYSDRDMSLGGSEEFTDDNVEINGIDSHILKIQPVPANGMSALDWWKSQSKEFFSRKPVNCYTVEETKNIRSIYDETDIVVQFSVDVVRLKLLRDTCVFESDMGNYIGEVLIVPHKENLILIHYSGTDGEDILSTFKLID